MSLLATIDIEVCFAPAYLASPEVTYLPLDDTLMSFFSELNFCAFETILFRSSRQRVPRWRCPCVYFHQERYYVDGKLTVLANAFSRLPHFDSSGPERRKNDGANPITVTNYSTNSTFFGRRGWCLTFRRLCKSDDDDTSNSGKGLPLQRK